MAELEMVLSLHQGEENKFRYFIASSSEEILVRKNCIALFNFYPQNSCIGVGLIDTLSSIVSHL